jgi:Fungal specific transcription factor domain
MSAQPFQPPDAFGVSPDGGTELSYGSLIDVATARWFGMLANDAEMGTIDLEEYSGVQGQPNAPEMILQAAETWTRAADQSTRSNFHSGIEWEIRRNLSVDQQGPGKSTLDVGMWKSPQILTLREKEQHPFEIFVNRISHWMDLFDPFRHFCTLVPRLAMYNEGLLNAILAFSVRYLSLNPEYGHEDHHERHDALRYYHESLHYVQNAMQYNSYLTSLELLATAIIISGYEMLDGSRRDWERHLQGVFGIQRSQVIHGDTGGLRGAVWWTWLQQDIWAAFRDKRKTFTFWRPVRTFDMLNPWEIAARSIFVMAKVVNYCSGIENSGEDNNIQSRIDAADRLTSMLDDWERHLTIEFAPLPLTHSDDAAVFKLCWIQPPIFGMVQMFE